MKTDPLITGAPQIHTNASFMVSNQHGTLLVTSESAPNIARAMVDRGSKSALRVALAVDPRANAFLIWTPGNEGPVAVTPNSDGSKMSAQFLCIVQDQKKEECVLHGDGYSLLLSNQSWNKLADALKNPKEFSLPLSGSQVKDVSLVYKQTTYQNPIDGKGYVAPDGWVQYRPSGKNKAEAGPVNTKEVILLTDQAEIENAISVESLAAYIKDLEKVAQVQLGALHAKAGQEVMLQCELTPGKVAQYTLAIRPGAAGTDIIEKSFDTALHKVKAPAIKGKIKFQLLLGIKPH